jgi:hypothetical protein
LLWLLKLARGDAGFNAVFNKATGNHCAYSASTTGNHCDFSSNRK